MTLNVHEIYDKLLDFESKTKNKEGQKQLYPIHKKLHFKEEKYDDISDWIIEHLKINEKDYILDAGCGVGYVLTKVCTRFNCTGYGISLSENEINYAKNTCKELGLENQVSFEQRSFDEKFNRKFDVIIAIESIKHSMSVDNTIENLVLHLNPGGRIFILDDYISDSRYQFLIKQVKKYWVVNSFFSFSSVTEKLTEMNLPLEVLDFTKNVDFTKKHFSAIKVAIIYLFLFFIKFSPVHKLYSIYFAGFCLERLYKKRAMEYKAIVATNIIQA